MSGQISFILWRETIEALLVIGILSSWLAREGASRRAAIYLWGGVAAGIALAVTFALAVLGFASILPESAHQTILTAMIFVSVGLIVQMVMWMRARGRSLKRDLEQGLRAATADQHWWAVFVLAMFAVAREGSETVIFLYGTIAAAPASSLGGIAASISIGLFAALATYAVLRTGSRLLPWRGFFRVSEALLLLLGCALFVTGVGNLVGQGFLPFGRTLWDTSFLLDDTGRIGGLVAALTGYRSAPDTVILSAWVVYWGTVAMILRMQTPRRQLKTA